MDGIFQEDDKMKKYAKDVLKFSAGSMVLGGSAAAVGSAFPGYAGGLSAMGSMMPAMGSIVGAKHMIRMTGNLMPKKKRK